MMIHFLGEELIHELNIEDPVIETNHSFPGAICGNVEINSQSNNRFPMMSDYRK